MIETTKFKKCCAILRRLIKETMNLDEVEISPKKNVYHNLTPMKLIEKALERNEGRLAKNGSLVVRTGSQTGRSPFSRFIVSDEITKDSVDWNLINRPVDESIFDELFRQAADHISNGDIFLFDGFVGADRHFAMPLRVITTYAWHSLFAQTLFVRPSKEEFETLKPKFHVINAFGMKIDPVKFGLKNEAFIAINFKRNMILIIGTGYGGEIKKGIFSVMNYLLPEKEVFPMHCSANIGKNGDTALFFGLSGTGKTTLSADPARSLIGDDEHGWSDHGIFNFEGGCYAKVIHLSKESEPQIYNAIKSGSVLENVVVDNNGQIDYNSAEITENTRATYPIEHIPNAVISGMGAHPKNIFFLTCDAFGVLPPISKLTPDEAMYHFISGYTAKVAGTEVGIKEPTATFSPCFGAPFLPLHPSVYAKMLGEKMKRHKTNVWLINTGWSGGPYGTGSRMKIDFTRAILNSALDGRLDSSSFKIDPVFKLQIPSECPGVPTEILEPKNTWNDKKAYDIQALKLRAMFEENIFKMGT